MQEHFFTKSIDFIQNTCVSNVLTHSLEKGIQFLNQILLMVIKVWIYGDKLEFWKLTVPECDVSAQLSLSTGSDVLTRQGSFQ